MFAAGLITFRETLEAALVIGIILSFLIKTNQQLYTKYVWQGVTVGVLLSLLLAYILNSFFGGFTGITEQIFEGVLMFVTAGFLVWMILWVHRQKGVVKKLEAKVAEKIKQGFPLGIFFLVVSSLLREGVETVLYLRAMSSLGGAHQLIGALGGIVLGVITSYVVFTWSLHMHIGKLLKVTGAILLLFGAGLAAHGVHEFQEAGLLPLFSFDPLINISHFLSNHSFVGSMLRTLFGYTATPTMMEALFYGGYIALIFVLEIVTTNMLRRKYA